MIAVFDFLFACVVFVGFAARLLLYCVAVVLTWWFVGARLLNLLCWCCFVELRVFVVVAGISLLIFVGWLCWLAVVCWFGYLCWLTVTAICILLHWLCCWFVVLGCVAWDWLVASVCIAFWSWFVGLGLLIAVVDTAFSFDLIVWVWWLLCGIWIYCHGFDLVCLLMVAWLRFWLCLSLFVVVWVVLP